MYMYALCSHYPDFLPFSFFFLLVLRWNNLENLSNVLYMVNSGKQALINTECFQSGRLTLMESDVYNLTEATCKRI